MNTKERIVVATIELIKNSKNNAADISNRAIAQKAGVNNASINYHFQSKERLIGICVERMLGEIDPSGMSPAGLLKHKLKAVFDLFVAYPTVAKISILAEILGYDLYNKQQRDIILDSLADNLLGNTEKLDPKPEIKQEKRGNENSQR
ncbi:MAG: TetR/AcrR family transcriptional regulator [Chitinivibrionia bacterium]|nr:TetR/AcrR family transcriptional regulator [Chitinivibrionia bacterium]